MRELFLAHCKNCKSDTVHAIQNISRTRGYKLVCTRCGTIQARYTANPKDIPESYPGASQ